MRIKSLSIIILMTLSCSCGLLAQEKKPVKSPRAKRVMDSVLAAKDSIYDKLKGSFKSEGLFTFYQDSLSGSLMMYVKKNQIDKEYIYQSFSLNGPTSLFLHRNILRTNLAFKVQKTFDKLEFARLNTNFYYDKNNAISKTDGVDVAEAVFLAERVTGEDENGYLINADGLFLAEKMDPVKALTPPGIPPGLFFNLGGLNPQKSNYNSIKSYPNNTNILVDLADKSVKISYLMQFLIRGFFFFLFFCFL